jgi:hypothetical protein
MLRDHCTLAGFFFCVFFSAESFFSIFGENELENARSSLTEVGMKRHRVDGVSMAAEPFAFRFGNSEGSGAAVPPVAAPEPSTTAVAPPLPPGLLPGVLYARLLFSTGVSVWGESSYSTAAFSSGEVVRVQWADEGSVGGYLCVESLPPSPKRRGVVPAAALTLVPSPTDERYSAWLQGSASNAAALQLDTTLGSGGSGALATGVTPLTLQVEPGLDSLVHPLSPTDFCARFLAQRALCIHASASRLAELQAAFSGFHVPTLLSTASRLVVWLRARGTGRMQYIESSPELAAAAYAAGHSIYFNPPLPLQERYMRALCADLGMGTGGALGGLEGGGGTSSSSAAAAAAPSTGGDIELFACAGAHSTPWHWDAQENFTLQLRGTKRWRVARSGVAAPLTNWHPLSATSLAEDGGVLRASGVGEAALTPPPPGAPGEACFVLRPGSFLYTPAGFWHAVDSEGEEEGSLSMNFSCSGVRWGDVVLRAVTQHLWGGGGGGGGGALAAQGAAAGAAAGLRERVVGLSGRAAALEKLQGLLDSLPSLLSTLKAEQVLCPAVFCSAEDEQQQSGALPLGSAEAAKEAEEAEEAEEEGEGGAGAAGASHAALSEEASLDAVLDRNQLGVMHVEAVESLEDSSSSSSSSSGSSSGAPPVIVTVSSLFASGYGASELRAPGCIKFSLQVPAALRPLLDHLQALPLHGGCTTRRELLRIVAGKEERLQRLAGTLITLLQRRGLLVARK